MPAPVGSILRILDVFCAVTFHVRWLRSRRALDHARSIDTMPQVFAADDDSVGSRRKGRTFLENAGTELICSSGHGALHVPLLEPSTLDHERWAELDSSWMAVSGVRF